ncbi:MAG: hypothetical protein R2798_00725 [Chitinophagales bacterium]|nr:hypothetical protein [Bacteroidota bacterium]
MFTKVFGNLLLLTLFCVGVLLLLQYSHILPSSLLTISWASLLFYAIFTFVVLGSVKLFKLQEKGKNFTGFLMAAIFLRFLLSAIFATIYIYGIKPTNKLFIIPFFSFFVVFAVFEYYYLIKISKKVPQISLPQ